MIRATESPEKRELMALLSETLPIPDSSKAISLAIENGDLAALQVLIVRYSCNEAEFQFF